MDEFTTGFSYTTTNDGEFKKDTMTQTVNFKNLLRTQVDKEIKTLISNIRVENDKPQPKFQIKFEFSSIKNDIFEVFYISKYPICVTCVLEISRNFESYHKIKKESHQLQANKWLYIGTIPKRDLKNYTTVHITFEFKYQILQKNIKIDKSYTPDIKLANDFENLLTNELFTDVTMKSTEGIEFKVHRNILAARSVVLKANFEHNTTECHTNIIESPLEADVLREVLRFIYSNKAPKVDEIPEKLLAGADYYQLEGLKILCEEPLLDKLTIQNAIEILQLADLHSAYTLKQNTLEFIKNSPMWEITKTDGWSNIKSVELLKCMFEYITAEGVNKCDTK